MFHLPLPPLEPPKGGFYSPQTPNVSESVVALSEDSFPAKKKKYIYIYIYFLGHLGRLKPGDPLKLFSTSQIQFRIFLKKKIKFLGFHGVVLEKTFPLMYQLLM